jgi:hypothetical protein
MGFHRPVTGDRGQPGQDLGMRVDDVFAELSLSFDDDDDDPGAAGLLVPIC